jgi:Type I phosphodiesterase / nucleotide pyrophosphatase
VPNLVLVVDGLRPDSITASETPNLRRLREEGVNFPNGHSVFPTVTRVNTTAIGTDTYPDRFAALGQNLAETLGQNHAAIGGGVEAQQIPVVVVAEGMVGIDLPNIDRVAEHAVALTVMSSGTTGSALLVNPRAPKVVNGYWEPGARVAFPDAANDTILRRFAGRAGQRRDTGSFDRIRDLDAAGAA